MNETLLTVFIAVTSIAVVLQMAILAAMFFSMKKSSARMESLAKQVEEKALPALENAQQMLTEIRPKLTEILDNAMVTTRNVREQSERLSLTLNDIVDRTRLQVIRADELVSRTMDRVEETTEAVHHTVLSPVRQLSALMSGVFAGFGEYMGGRKVRHQQRAVPQEEMFI